MVTRPRPEPRGGMRQSVASGCEGEFALTLQIALRAQRHQRTDIDDVVNAASQD